MTQNNLTTRPIRWASLGKRAALGGAIALTLMIVFLLQVRHPDPEWGRFWMIRPLIVVTFAGAMGGVCYYALDHIFYKGGWRKILVALLGLIVYIFGLWMGTVLGLAGTLWH